MNEKEKTIQKYMKSLDISREEAEQLWEDDHSDYESEEMKKMAEGAKQIKRYEQSEKERKKSTRERKVDETKGRLIGEVKELLEKLGANVQEVKTETEIKFAFENEDYTFKLTKHRKPKG